MYDYIISVLLPFITKKVVIYHDVVPSKMVASS